MTAFVDHPGRVAPPNDLRQRRALVGPLHVTVRRSAVTSNAQPSRRVAGSDSGPNGMDLSA